jgi:hypothetical protein
MHYILYILYILKDTNWQNDECDFHKKVTYNILAGIFIPTKIILKYIV